MFTSKKYTILYIFIFLSVFIFASKITNIDTNEASIAGLSKNESASSPTRAYRKNNKNIDIRPITQGDFFTIEKIAPKEPIKNTTLKISLLGIIQGQSSEASSAIISNKGSTLTYKIKEKIEGTNGSVSLHEIEQNRIILDNNGKLEILELFTPLNISGSTQRPTALRPTR